MKDIIMNRLRTYLDIDGDRKFDNVPHTGLVRAFYKYAGDRMAGFYPAPAHMGKKVVYATMEILPGRSISNNLMNLPEAADLTGIMDEAGVSINELEECEEEPKTGNGGLGRLAGCMIESAATMHIPFEAATIRFRNGLFRQDISSGRQIALDDSWMNDDGRYPFEIECTEDKQNICFNENGHTVIVEAIPCLIPVLGYAEPPEAPFVNYIRMWKTGNIYSGQGVDTSLYSRIDDRLYPDSSTESGKRLRLIQEYFLSAANVGMVFREMEENKWPPESLPDKFCIHINDTHTALMIPEVMRRLTSATAYNMSKAQAREICRRLFVYTNHTIMAEALEEWDISLVESLLPEVYREIDDMHHVFEAEINARYDNDIEKASKMCFLWDGRMSMAKLAIFASGAVNGVAKLHTEILKHELLADFYDYFPEKFFNVTNGVTQRKFMGHANPELSCRLDEWTGDRQWRREFSRIARLDSLVDDPDVRAGFEQAHIYRKKALRDFIYRQRRIDIPVDFLYDVQIKRFHEYKRQLMSALKIIDLYLRLKKDPDMQIEPTAFIFAGKAAESYFMAKEVIALILAIEKLIKEDEKISKKIRVAFVENYDVSKCELIIPAADCSEQISTASKEASGTGNMKFMMNGAVTLGTLDGANVEIFESVGSENMFIFGLPKDGIVYFEKNPGAYSPTVCLEKCEGLKAAINALRDGTVRRIDPKPGEDPVFNKLADDLTKGVDGRAADPFFTIIDYPGYMEAFMAMNKAFSDKPRWYRMCLKNIAGSAEFSSDRMVREYAEYIWKL